MGYDYGPGSNLTAQDARRPVNTDWLIIGGGIHGVHIAVRLIGQLGVPSKNVAILDPAACLLSRWRSSTDATGMDYLRSPSVHHIDLNPWSLDRFAGRRKKHTSSLFAPPYARPALSLFNRHCDHVIDAYGLEATHVRAQAVGIYLGCDHVSVDTADGRRFSAGHVVLAIGTCEQPAWPSWAPTDDPRVQHLFSPLTTTNKAADGETVLVVGGGISAAQIALRLAHEGRAVHVVSRHALRVHQFDSDPGWLGPKLMRRFDAERDVQKRRSMIRDARHRGSVPPDLKRKLRGAVAKKHIGWSESQVLRCIASSDRLELQLSSGQTLRGERLLLATGFEPQRPGGAMLDRLIVEASLPCAECGYPVVDRSLRWHPRVHVTGPLAELELGPTSRNIAGARQAGERLVGVFRRP